MKNLAITAFLLLGTLYPIPAKVNGGNGFTVTATCYHPTAAQCNSSPLITASGKHINPDNPIQHRWIAVSRDLHQHLAFGDTVIVSGTYKKIYDGKWVVNDLMNRRWTLKIDFLVGQSNYISKWTNIKIQKQ